MKVLVLVNAHALAHVSRPLEISKLLAKRGHEIVFAGHGKYLDVVVSEGYHVVELPYIPADRLFKAIKSQKLYNIFKRDELFNYVEAEIALYKRLKPKLVIIDNRVTANTSAEIAGIKSVSIVNLHMSLYKKIPFYSLRNRPILKSIPFIDFTDRIERNLEHIFYNKLVMANMNKVRRYYGLDAKFSYALEEGDLTLFPDIPEFIPASHLPDNGHYIGPLTWHNTLPEPKCAKRIEATKKCIYLTLGSGGLEELINKLAIFSEKNMQVVIATGQMSITHNLTIPENVFIEKYVNTDKLLPHCDLVVCHGGNGTIYQALSHGLPIVGCATHEEQNYGLKRINQLELGIGFSNKKLIKFGFDYLVENIDRVISNSSYRNNAKRIQNIIQQWNGPELAAQLIEQLAQSNE